MENLKPASELLDLAIIGGGPAGSAAALEASRRGLRVAIWERDRLPRDKVCGEFISPEALPWLQSEIPGAAACGAEIRCASFVSGHGLLRTFRLPRPALGLSRRQLDAALWKAVEAAGVDAHEGVSVRTVHRLDPGGRQASAWEIESAAGIARRAKALVIACGRWWNIEGLCSPARQLESQTAGEWVGFKAHFAGISPRSKVEMYFFRGGYCGVAPVEGGSCNVCCLVHRERIQRCRGKELEDFAAWLAQVSDLGALESRLRGAEQVSQVVTTAPVHLARRQAAQRGALMVGDASGFLDPFTGEGISMALHSGRLAAQAVAKTLSEGHGDDRAVEIYGHSLAFAVQRSYRIAAVVRGLLQGPMWLRSVITAPLPWVGRRLVHETRWRGHRKVYPAE